MRTSNPNATIPYVWDQNNDVFNSTQLVANWDAIDAAIAAAKPTNQFAQGASLVTTFNSTTDRGKLTYLTSADQGFPSGQVVYWNGTQWLNTRGVELLSALPTQNLFDGRMVLLSAAAGGFAQWTLVRYQGGSWFIVNQGVEVLSSVPVSNNFAGRVVVLSASSGAFNAFDVIRYDGTNWARVGPQPVPPSTELAYFAHTTALTTSTTAAPGTTLTTFGAATYENVKYYFDCIIPFVSSSVANPTITLALYESATQIGFSNLQLSGTIGNGTHIAVKIPFVPTAASHTYSVAWWTSAGTATIPTAATAGTSIFRVVKA